MSRICHAHCPAPRRGGGLLGALVTAVTVGGVGALGIRALEEASGGLAAADAAVESTLSIVVSAGALGLVGALAGLGIWSLLSLPRRRAEAARVAQFRARSVARHHDRAVAAATRPAVTAAAVRLDGLEHTATREPLAAGED